MYTVGDVELIKLGRKAYHNNYHIRLLHISLLSHQIISSDYYHTRLLLQESLLHYTVYTAQVIKLCFLSDYKLEVMTLCNQDAHAGIPACPDSDPCIKYKANKPQLDCFLCFLYIVLPRLPDKVRWKHRIRKCIQRVDSLIAWISCHIQLVAASQYSQASSQLECKVLDLFQARVQQMSLDYTLFLF